MQIRGRILSKRGGNDGIQDAQVDQGVQDPLHVPDGPITRSRAKKIKEAMNVLVLQTLTEALHGPSGSSTLLKIGLRDDEPALIHLIQAMEDKA